MLKQSAEMLTHIPMCSHPNVNSVLLINENSEISDELAKHTFGSVVSVELKKEVLNALAGFNDGQFDIIIANIDLDGGEPLLLPRVVKLLSAKGVAVFKSPTIFDKSLKKLLASVPESFIVSMPYTMVKEDGAKGFVYLSKKFHPIADIVLHTADLLEGCEYYNAQMHRAAFELPQAHFQALTGYARR